MMLERGVKIPLIPMWRHVSGVYKPLQLAVWPHNKTLPDNLRGVVETSAIKTSGRHSYGSLCAALQGSRVF